MFRVPRRKRRRIGGVPVALGGRAFEILTHHRDKLTEISEVLMKDETIDAERFEDFFRTNPPQFVPAPALG